MRIWAALILASAAAACSPPPPALERSTLVLNHQDGSVPPPYHREWGITIPPDGPGTLTYWPGYEGSGVVPAERTFPVPPARRAALVQAMQAAGVTTRRWRTDAPPSVGGGSEQIEVRGGGRTLVIPGALPAADEKRLAPVRTAFDDAVPQDVWQSTRDAGR